MVRGGCQRRAQDPRFDREFAGLKKFEPISRAHEGLVHILHVGRNEAAGQLYYVMELADSCASVKGEDAEGGWERKCGKKQKFIESFLYNIVLYESQERERVRVKEKIEQVICTRYV